jgi:regulatory protein
MAARAKAKKLDADGLWNYALRLLQGRAHSVGELKQKLARRAASTSDTDATLHKLRSYGFTDDRKFSEAFAASRLENKGFGPARVLRDLRARRVATSLAEGAVKRTFAGIDEQQLVADFLARRYRGKNLAEFLSADKNLASVYRRLRTAGFGSRAVLAVLKQHRTLSEDFGEPVE